MVEIIGIGIPNFIPVILGLLVLGIIIWIILRHLPGREGIDKTEQKQTKQLLNDEKKEEDIQKQERKICKKLKEDFGKIMDILIKKERKDIIRKISDDYNIINSGLNKLEKEEISVNDAIKIFSALYSSTKKFLESLPGDDNDIKKLRKQIIGLEAEDYKGLIKEIGLDKEKEQIIRQLTMEVAAEEGMQLAA